MRQVNHVDIPDCVHELRLPKCKALLHLLLEGLVHPLFVDTTLGHWAQVRDWFVSVFLLAECVDEMDDLGVPKAILDSSDTFLCGDILH